MPEHKVSRSQPARLLHPLDPLSRLHGVGPATAAHLARAGLRTMRDLLLWFPRRLRELRPLDAPREDAVGSWVRMPGRVQATSLRWLPGRRSLVSVRLAAADGTPFEVALFNQPWLKNAHPPGSARTAQGVLARRGGRWVLEQGVVRADETLPPGPCQLAYGEVEGVSAARLAALIRSALERTDFTAWPSEPIPASLRAALPPLAAALRAIHQPADAAEHEAARRRFAVLEAVRLFRRVERARRRRALRRGAAIALTPRIEQRIARVLPYAWTDDQREALAALRRMLAGPAPMGALLHGDVGTGKTAVALYAALAVIAAGHQVAFLAPTELLAEQHHELLTALLTGSAVRAHLLTASVGAAARQAAEHELRSGEAHLVVGTHALLSEATAFQDLGLVVIDEQHRFGVEQRQRLVQKGADPHVLVMTATPIPRTLALTLFGDLDLIALREKPAGHRRVPAVQVPPRAWPRLVRAIARHVRRGGRAYVVCGRIGEDGEKGGAVRVHADLAARFRCGLVHGRMPVDERRRVTAAFRRGALDVLVGTTVLEVGVDVPEATLIVVVGADRLGLATLHQLRGRVGRGGRRGLCVLTGARNERTDAICATADGFELAESDLRLRGAGELLGTRQSGLADLRALDPIEDLDILLQVREAVRVEATP